MANDTEFGLISYVYAADPGTGVKVARQMESGMVAVNRGIASDPAAPFGGMKESGLGREGGFGAMARRRSIQLACAEFLQFRLGLGLNRALLPSAPPRPAPPALHPLPAGSAARSSDA